MPLSMTGRHRTRVDPKPEDRPGRHRHPHGQAAGIDSNRKGQAMPEHMTAPMGDGFDQMARDAVYRAMFTRRDVRSHFLPTALDDELLARLLLAAHHAPSVGFMQPWNFIVIRDAARRAEVRDLFLAAREQEL